MVGCNVSSVHRDEYGVGFKEARKCLAQHTEKTRNPVVERYTQRPSLRKLGAKLKSEKEATRWWRSN
jgi:hypothetical protein